jgi:cytochrome c oxidase cbb3-type subunit 3
VIASRTAGIVAALAALFALGACEREQRRFTEVAPAGGLPHPPRTSSLQPGGSPPSQAGSAAGRVSLLATYDENAWAISEGKRYFEWFNCNGCHANGGGGMGPALIDRHWIYGSEPADIYETIVQGRPNGMPAFRGRIPNQQVWQIAAYVRSLGALNPKDARPQRSDSLFTQEPPGQRATQQPTGRRP